MPQIAGWYVVVYDGTSQLAAAPTITADFAATGASIILINAAFEPGEARDRYLLVHDGEGVNLSTVGWRTCCGRTGVINEQGSDTYYVAFYVGPDAPTIPFSVESVRTFCRKLNWSYRKGMGCAQSVNPTPTGSTAGQEGGNMEKMRQRGLT
jgi:hypothetical protein